MLILSEIKQKECDREILLAVFVAESREVSINVEIIKNHNYEL